MHTTRYGHDWSGAAEGFSNPEIAIRYTFLMDSSQKIDATNASQANALASGFETTHWSIVLQAARRSSCQSETELTEQALADLCQAYWLPLYSYLRRRVHDAHRAEDLTQAFFAKLLEKDFLRTVDPSQGRFRAFLLTALKRFTANEWKKEVALKRGGGKTPLSLDFTSAERYYRIEHSDSLTPEEIFMRNWVRTVLDRVLERMRAEFSAAGKAGEFAALEPFITPRQDQVDVVELAKQLDISEGAVRVAGHRIRKRYRRILREEIAQTVAHSEDVEDEIRSLFAAFAD